MRLDPHQLRCTECLHEWQGEMLTDCGFNLAIAAIRDVQCPECKADYRKITLRLEHRGIVR